jgi:hypothetical protein
MGGTTIYRTLSCKRTTFQTGSDCPTCEWCLEKDESATHILCDYEAIANLKFRHLGHFNGTKWPLWRSYIQSPTFHSKCRIDKGVKQKRGSTIDNWKSQCKGWKVPPLMHAFIQVFITRIVQLRRSYVTYSLVALHTPVRRWWMRRSNGWVMVAKGNSTSRETRFHTNPCRRRLKSPLTDYATCTCVSLIGCTNMLLRYFCFYIYLFISSSEYCYSFLSCSSSSIRLRFRLSSRTYLSSTHLS